MQLREIELKVQREINEKRQELLAKEESLRLVIYGVTPRVSDSCFAGTWRADLLPRAPRASSGIRYAFVEIVYPFVEKCRKIICMSEKGKKGPR